MIMSRAMMLFLAVLLAGGVSQENVKYSGPNCLGPFCINHDVSVRTVFKHLGAPISRASKFSPYCYKAEDGKAFAYFDTMGPDSGVAGALFLSDFPNCVRIAVQITHDDLRRWKTPEGIGLGSSQEDVIKVYGSTFSQEKVVAGDSRILKFMIRGYRQGDPSRRIGDKTVSYNGAPDDLRTAEFCIRDGKVSCIFMSHNE
jgi:hypothetical protein